MIVPWVWGIVTAAWFGLMARQAGRSMPLWALGGGFFALATTTIVWGIGHAAAIPFSDADKTSFHIRWTVEAVLLVLAFGWLPAFYMRGRRASSPTSGPT